LNLIQFSVFKTRSSFNSGYFWNCSSCELVKTRLGLLLVWDIKSKLTVVLWFWNYCTLTCLVILILRKSTQLESRKEVTMKNHSFLVPQVLQCKAFEQHSQSGPMSAHN